MLMYEIEDILSGEDDGKVGDCLVTGGDI